MIDRELALERAQRHLSDVASPGDPNRPIINGSLTVEHEFGWVFFYQSARFFRTGDQRARLVGNPPLIVDRRDGSVYVMPDTARSPDIHIETFRRAWLEGRSPEGWPAADRR